MPRLERLWPVLVLLLLPALPLWRAVALGETLGPWDQVRRMAPWNGPDVPGAWDALQADAVLQSYPWRDLVHEAWRSGELPLWNPYVLAGTPLAANSQSGAFSPLTVLTALAGMPTGVALTLLAWIHLAVAGLGARSLALRLGATPEGAVLAGALFGASPFLVAWAPLASVPATLAWLPWMLLATLALFDSTSPWRAAAGLGASGAMTLYGGHLQFAAYAFLGVLAFAATLSAAHRSPRGLGRVALGLAVGAALAGIQVVPALEFGKRSHRQGAPTAEGYESYRAASLGPIELVGAAFPIVGGLPGSPLAAAPDSGLPGYWPAYAKRGANFAEAAVGVGPALALLFALRRPRSGRSERAGFAALVAVALVGLGLALGPLSALLYWGLPGWSATGSPGRAAILVVLATAVLAGLAWPRDEAGARRAGVGLGVLVGLTVLGVLGLGAASSSWVGDLPIGEFASAQLGQSLAAVSGAAVAILVACVLAARGRGVAALASMLAASLAAGPMGAATSGRALPAPEPSPDPNRRRAYLNAPWDLFRPAPALMPPNTGVLTRVPELGGYDSLVDRETVGLLREVNGEDPAPAANGNMMFVKPGFEPQRLAEAGVTEVWSTRPIQALGDPMRGPGGVVVYQLDGPGRVSLEGGSARIVRDGFDRQTVAVSGPGRLTVRDRNLPGWTATAGGRPLAIEPGRWRVVAVPPGVAEVRFLYAPPGLALGAAMSAIGLLALGALSLLGGRWGREALAVSRDARVNS